VTFARQRLPELFRRLKQDYQVILVDTTPVLPLPDTLLLAELADAVVLSVRRDVSRLSAVRAAYERLSLFPCRLLGAVVNGERGLHYGSYYSYRAAYSGPHS
jgi:polysaccharide biosynthesis transport protein